jgi:hypothetical protein
MWYLYSLLVCYVFGVLLITKIINQAECKGTPLTDAQMWVAVLSMVVMFSIPLLNVIFSIEIICSLLFKPHELENEIDELIDHIRRTIH